MTFRTCVAALSVLALLSGCGGSDDTRKPTKPLGPESQALREKLTAATSTNIGAFPVVAGQSLQEFADSLDGAGPQLAFATQNLTPGPAQRLAFGVIDKKTGFVYAPTAVYIATSQDALAQGPFVAPADLLVTDPPFRSKTAATETDPFAAVYQTNVSLPKPGRYAVLAVSRIGNQNVGSGGTIDVVAKSKDPVPDVGDSPPAVSTNTLAAAGGNIKSIDTRVPPDDMHDVNFKDVLGKEPTVLLMATPQLCQSRVCGPVVDIAAQLKKQYGDRVAFIHQEVYVDNDANKPLRAPLRAFGLPTEPWLFAVNAKGRITARLEGSFGFSAFEKAIKSALS